LFQIYMALKEDASFQLKPLTTSFRDSVIEERTEKLMPQSSEFWKTALADYKRLDVFSAEPTAVLLRKRYDGTFLQRLRDKSKTDGLSLQTVFFGAYAFALKMLSYEEDIVLGLVSNNRPMVEDADKVLGCFLNTLPVRIKFQEMRDISWIAYLKKLDRQLKQLMSQSRLTLMEIAKVASDEPSQSNPFFDAIFNFLDFHIYNDIASSEQSDASEQEEEELNLDSYAVSNTLLDLDVSLTGQSLNFDYRLGRSLKSGISLEQFHAYLEKVLMCYLDQASEKMRSGNVLSEREQQFLLTSYSPAAPTATDRPTVVELFAKQVAEKPDQIALVFEDKRWSYRQLDQQANQLAAYLQERCQPAADDCIGLLLPRNEWLITAMLAVLKAGAAYVPIDPDYPEVRKNYILEDASCKLILDETELANFQQVADHYPHTAPAVTPKASDLMYLIYTSGSTGRPKGVMLEHASVAAFLNGLDAQLGYEEAQIIAATTNVTFDISVLEIFGTLCSGRQLVLFGEGQIDPEAFVQKLQEEKVELLQLTPSRLMQFTDILFQKMLPSLKHLLVGGEVFPEKIYERRAELSDIRIVNVYGPTETTIWSAALHIHQSTQLSIGQPLDNEQIYILNPSGDLQTIGVVGEICIGGAGLARGYWKRPELTKERFIQHPFIPGERLYKTGDLGRWCEDGNIEYLGRFDEQVKIRGHRIELGEIETAMAGYAASWQQIVVLAKERNGEQVLAAYFVAGETVDKLALRTYLQGQLPAYMIPAYFIELKEMLLTASGTVNKKALPGISEEDVIRKEFVEASNETELALMKYWQEVLDIRRISVTDNFFEVGGNSILVVRLFHKLKAELCDSLKITDLFNQTTIRQQAALIKTQEEPALMEINEIDF
ncbi:MAG: amino acid adenylation domain-containing protein, partial [Bacteroidota bacterium]